MLVNRFIIKEFENFVNWLRKNAECALGKGWRPRSVIAEDP
jgi:hypothetical protein